MFRIVVAVALLALTAAQPALAKGKTPTGTWLPVIKDVIREKLKNPTYVTFKLVFYSDKKTDKGEFPVCGFASYKQKKEEHAAKVSFYGLLTPPDAGKDGTFASVQMGETTEQAQQIAKTCKDNDIY